MAAPVSELGWVVYFAPVVRFTPLSPTYIKDIGKIVRKIVRQNRDESHFQWSCWQQSSTLVSDFS